MSLKKEFITRWTRTVVEVKEGIDRRLFPFFKREHHGDNFIMVPLNIAFSEIEEFNQNQKTKVTIEVIE
jgi:hypothetical protein